MPPEGYETITLPSNVVERLDNLADEINNPSRASVIVACMNAYESEESSDTVALDGGSVDDIANQTAQKVVRELESTLR